VVERLDFYEGEVDQGNKYKVEGRVRHRERWGIYRGIEF